MDKGIGMDFIAVDVETANPDLASICQIGLVDFESGRASEGWDSLVDPEDTFNQMQIAVHGITAETVQNAPTLPDLYGHLKSQLQGRVVVSHMPFDRVALDRAFERYGLPPIECTWLDTAAVARRCWEECAVRGYGLRSLAARLSIDYQPHNARDDARTAGQVLLAAIADSGLDLKGWLKHSRDYIGAERQPAPTIAQAGKPEGALYGHIVVFTGEISLPRAEAAQLAAEAGCTVATSVTKHTTLLVVGNQDLRRVGEDGKSSKQEKAEELIAKGQQIRILGESDFRCLLGMAPCTPGTSTLHCVMHASDFLPQLVVDSHCPYCGVAFAEPPRGKKRCPACGNWARVRTMDDGCRHLLTVAQCEAMDAYLRESWSS